MRERVESESGLVLRRWRCGDVRPLLTAFAEPEMSRQTAVPVDDVRSARRWLAESADRWEAGTGFAFAVTDAAGQVLGNVAVGAVDRRHGVGWVSYWTTVDARGRGVASAACRTVSAWAFQDAELFRLELGHRTNNPASCRVARAAGYAVEGVQREKLRYDGVRYDVELHARLSTDPAPPGR